MINFRYHLVSITAVFLALTIGLVLGTTALNGPTMDTLSESVSNLRGENENLRDQVVQLEQDAADEQQFSLDVAPTLLADRLDGESVAVVAAGSASPEHVTALIEMIELSGAEQGGRYVVEDAFFDPESSDRLLDVAAELTPSGFEPPNNADGVETVSALFSEGLFAEGEVEASDFDAVTIALTELELVRTEVEPEAEADVVLVAAGSPYSDADAEARNQAVVTMVREFADAGPTVLVTSTYVDDSASATVAEDPELGEVISTVDNISGPEGRLAAAMAVVERVSGDVGHYGTGDEATALAPQL